ncbi:ATP-binding protein [Pimelobacter sp. 30-1]|uniref:ATP-binding protein n=1 Tax=Pimelobacter sp. 30-1 TaxID=2004991 RepID=UPI001C03F180|nr:ATP-binding protein [Pimelobacter sp. 30-1]
MARLLHLNGAPGVGKSTLAQRYAAEHPGVLACDIDRLRCFVGGWEDDFAGAGAVIRPVAQAMIAAHLAEGRDVVLPQMLADEDERARFRSVAVDAGHAYVHVLLQAPRGIAADRLHARPAADPLHAVVHAEIERAGGAAAVEELADRLERSAARDPDVLRVDTGGSPTATYEALVAALG